MAYTDTDFRSGANMQDLNELIDQFDELDRHEFDDAIVGMVGFWFFFSK